MTRRQSFSCQRGSWTHLSAPPDPYSNTRIVKFAERIGVVGQLQNRKELPYTHFHRHLAKIRHIVTESALTDGWGIAPAR
jgi:hypothetical protein